MLVKAGVKNAVIVVQKPPCMQRITGADDEVESGYACCSAALLC
ncbi:MAG: hypothetical protein ACR2P4_07180 [Gammaproteobacteria bacterium]